MRHAAVLAGFALFLGACAPAIPEPSSTARAKAQQLRVARPCRGSELGPKLVLQGATGKLVGGISFRIASKRPCSVFPAPPLISVVGARQRVLLYDINPADLSNARDPRSLIRLRRGDRLFVDLVWSNWCGPPPAALIVKLRSSGRVRVPVAETPRCDSMKRPTRIGVSPIVPVR
jgi:hypothetical protein